MKRIFPILLTGAMLFLLASCNKEFIFRDNHFGNSIEQVQQSEGSDGEFIEWNGFEDHQILRYTIEGYHNYEDSLYYFFKDDELKHISEMFLYDKEKQQDVYDDLKKDLMEYGTPTEESKQPQVRKALWESGNYGIVLLVMDNAVLITYSLDSSKAKMFYATNHMSDLLSEGESVIPTPAETPEGWNSLNVDSFIPIPQEGCDYIVRNSIREEELSIFRSNPSIQQVIETFGYPPLAKINNDGQGIYLYYLVDDNKLDVVYDLDFNLVDLNYSGSLTGVPEFYSKDVERPISIIRNDIIIDELSFIDIYTTAEELQDVLGAPHRECYTFEMLFDRLSNNCITFFMSSHFLYPLTDGMILDIQYSKGENSNELTVSKAVIYDANGEFTVLAER